MSKAGNFIVNDLGFRDYQSRILELESLLVKAGFPENGAVAPIGEDGVASMSEMVVIAMSHEFGLGNVPERSFIRTAIDENITKISNMKETLFDRVVLGTMTPKQAMSALGSFAVRLIRKKITDLKSPPNTLATRRAKGSSNPLIDDGQMRATVQHIVTGKA